MERAKMRKARNMIFLGLALFVLITPTVGAGHLFPGSPAASEQITSAQDTAAIRGVSTRTSTGPNDVPAGLVGWTDGDAAAFQALVVSGLFRAFGNATQPQASVRGVETFATGNATAEGSTVAALVAGTGGNAQGLNSIVIGVNGFSDGSATGPGARVISMRALTPGSATGSGSGVVGLESLTSGSATGPGAHILAVSAGSTGSATGDGTQVAVILANASGNAVGPDSLVRGARIITSGHANGSASAVQSVSVRALGNATGANSVVDGIRVNMEGIATGQGSGIFAVTARTNGTSGPATAVHGQTNSPQGIGIHGIANNNAGLAGRFDGRVQINCTSPPCLVVRGHGVADLAENMVALGRVQPGDVVVLAARGASWGVARTTRPYDTRVAGIVSTQPRILLQTRGEQTVPVAMAGIITARATTLNGAIRVGDLLTTSPTPGHLMRCSTPSRCTGAIVAKAVEPLRRGSGTILVLVWRQ